MDAHVDLEAIIEAGRRQGIALVAAIAMKDELAAALAARRMRAALCRVEAELARGARTRDRELESRLSTLHAFRASLARAPQLTDTTEWVRLVRWSRVLVPDPSGIGRHPHLFESRARKAQLGSLAFEDLCVVDGDFAESTMLRSMFDHSLVIGCDFSRACLARTSWRGARLVRCSFAGVDMIDACLDGAVFHDCDLRGADLAAVNRGEPARARRTRFVESDLRETRWSGRQLAGARFERCRMFGAHGRPILEGVEIDRPDLSIGADRSRVGTAADVLRQWGVRR